MDVIKANGEIVPFDPNRIRATLRRLQTETELIEHIVNTVGGKVHDRMSTSNLYSIVFQELKQLQKGAAGKYNLKKAILQLGPTGFPFERLIAALFESDGFTTETGQITQGACVSHEVDVIASKNNVLYHAECKFHSFQGKVCDVKHALYADARFRDIGKVIRSGPDKADINYKGWLITNTRMTSDALTYGTCAGLGLLSWDFPEEKSLRGWIDRSGLHPVTCLTSLSVKTKQQLIDKGVTLCRDLTAAPEILSRLGVPEPKIEEAVEEAYAICQGPTSAEEIRGSGNARHA